MKYRVVLLVLALLLSSCIVILPVAAEEADVWDGSVASGFAGGDGSEKNPYIIETAEQLALLAQNVNRGKTYQGNYFKLTCDLMLNDENFSFDPDTGLVKMTDGKNTAYIGTGVQGDHSGDNTQFDMSVSAKGVFYDSHFNIAEYGGVLQRWNPIGQNGVKAFAGFFDGGGHTVCGMYVYRESWAGLFGFAREGAVSNLQIRNSVIIGMTYTASVAGEATVIGCESDAYVFGESKVSGIVGAGGAAYCINTGSVVSTGSASGIVGTGSAVYCRNMAAVSGDFYVGGIVSTGDAVYCYNTGTVSGSNYVGGIVGQMQTTYITYCQNEGDVTGRYYVGGIVGDGSAAYCSNTGDVSCTNMEAGGIAGVGGALCCYNTGDLLCSEKCDYVGGIVGMGKYYSEGQLTAVAYCYNTGDVSGRNNVGGIVGAGAHLEIMNCYNTGNTVGKVGVGGIVGEYTNKPLVNCYTLGTVTGESAVGGVAGSAENSYSEIKNAYYISGSAKTDSKTQYGIGHSEEGKVRTDLPGVTMGITLQEAELQQTYAFDFEAEWQMGGAEGYAYPVLQMLHHGDHVFDQQTVSDTLQYAPADCQTGATYYYSCTCGNISDKTFTYGDPAHTVNTRWESDDISHWHTCALCGVKLDMSDHTFGKSEIVQPPSGKQEGKLLMKCTECQKERILSVGEEQIQQGGQTQSVRKNSTLFTAVFIGVGVVSGGLLVYGFIVVREIVRKRK